MESRLVLDNARRSFTPGGIVSGYVEVCVRLQCYLKHIKINLIGWMSCKCDDGKNDGSCSTIGFNDAATVNTTVSGMENKDRGEQQILNDMKILSGGTGKSELAPLGCKRFKFELMLPKNIPPSFEGQYGYTRYWIRALIGSNFGDDACEEEIRVLNLLDLNTVAEARQPFHISNSMSVGFWCCYTGNLYITVTGPLRGFCPGQMVPFQIQIKNDSRCAVYKTTMDLYKNIQYRSMCATVTPKCAKVVIARGTDTTCVKARTCRKITILVQIPVTESTTCQPNSLIKINYFVEVHCFITCCHCPVLGSSVVYIGTVPATCGGPPSTQQPKKEQQK